MWDYAHADCRCPSRSELFSYNHMLCIQSQIYCRGTPERRVTSCSYVIAVINIPSHIIKIYFLTHAASEPCRDVDITVWNNSLYKRIHLPFRCVKSNGTHTTICPRRQIKIPVPQLYTLCRALGFRVPFRTQAQISALRHLQLVIQILRLLCTLR